MNDQWKIELMLVGLIMFVLVIVVLNAIHVDNRYDDLMDYSVYHLASLEEDTREVRTQVDTIVEKMNNLTFASQFIEGGVQGYAYVGCGSDSMGLTLRCGDKVSGTKVGENDTVELGRIYVYTSYILNDKKESVRQDVIHRLVACGDSYCRDLIMKGDNNAVAEHIDRSQLNYKVTLIEPAKRKR